MRMIMTLVFITGLTSFLTACASMSGNVVPEKGPTMEQVYDSMPVMKSENIPNKQVQLETKLTENIVGHEFHKLPNPELKIYVYPHLSGNDHVPIPGYYTVFNAYTQDHYELANQREVG